MGTHRETAASGPAETDAHRRRARKKPRVDENQSAPPTAAAAHAAGRGSGAGSIGPPPSGGIDPEDVVRKSSAMLEKKGFAPAAVGRAAAATSTAVTPDDVAQPFNEQKRRRVASMRSWLLANAELWELPKEEMEEARTERRMASRDDVGVRTDADTAVREGGTSSDGDGHLSARARALIGKGLLPIASEHVVRPGECSGPGKGPSDTTDREDDDGRSTSGRGGEGGGGVDTGAVTTGAAGTGAQDRQRTGKSLRVQRLERAERLARDLCPRLALGVECPHGDECRRLHDVEGYKRAKPADIPGPCPFVSRPGGDGSCPHGLRCRFLGAHGGGPAAVPSPAVPSDPVASAHPEVWTRGEVTGGGSNPTRGVRATGSRAELNAFTDSLQRDLARNAYPMPRSDQVLRRLNIPVKCLSYAQVDAQKARRAGGGHHDTDPPRVPVVREGSLGTREPGGREPRGGGARALDFRGKLYVAPLTTVGNLPFRRICVAMGADVTISEMAMASNLLKGDRSEWALLRRHPSEGCFGVQVCGGWPDLMSRCGELLDNEVDCDFVDVNMGCPIDGVCAKGAGSSMLRDEAGVTRMENVVRAMSGTMKRTPLTIKVRMGYDDDPAKYVAHDVLPRARRWGAAAATLHGRTRQQRYSRLADWAYIERCASAAAPSGLPLVGNGDVFCYRDYQRRMSSGNLATCMIGRGALIKPWVLTEIKERRVWDISASERLGIFRDFANHGLEHWGADEKGVETTRRFMLEWMSYTHRYVPVGLLERGVTQHMHLRPMAYRGRSELETLLASDKVDDWMRIAEMFLGKPAPGFSFVPKHKSNSYSSESAAALASWADDEGEQNG